MVPQGPGLSLAGHSPNEVKIVDDQPNTTHFFGPSTSRFEHLDEIRETISILQSLGIRVHPASRIKQYERVCENAARLWDLDDEQLSKDVAAFFHSLKEVQELHIIAKT